MTATDQRWKTSEVRQPDRSALPATPPPDGFRHSVAVVIGIDGYANGVTPLRTAVNDATRLAELLETAHGYQVHRLTQEASKAEIEQLFTQALPAQLADADRLLVYFAGHGVALDGDDGPEGFLVPQDARAEARESLLPMFQFHGWLNQLPCRHLLAILDCCFAGAFRWSGTRAMRAMPEVLHQERYDRFIRDPAWQVITSAAYDQEALDVLAGEVIGWRGDTNRTHSPFAQALFAALAGAGDLVPKGDGDGVITAAELHLYLRQHVEGVAEKGRHRQTPGLWSLRREYDKGEYIFLVPGWGQLDLPPAPPLTFENNPYKGLSAYDFNDQDARLFFGREDLEQELVERIDEQPLTLVLGASGTGKSSLVKAGLLPRLAGWRNGTEDEAEEAEEPKGYSESRGARTSSPHAAHDAPHNWTLLPPMRPTANPMRALLNLVRHELQPGDLAAPDQGVSPAQDPIAAILEKWLQIHPDRTLLLVVDQFEELITLCRQDQERTEFLLLLADLLDRHAKHFRLIFTLRSDFEPQFKDSPLAAHWTSSARYVVPPMDQDDLRRAIEGPASERVLYFEPPDLVDDLINEVIQTPGALPLLSFTLSELYVKYIESKSDNRALTQAHYQELGGVIGSLRVRADEEYRNLPDEAHRQTMQRVLLRMVAVEGGEIARRRVPLSELVYASEAENERVTEVLRRLVEARLVVKGRDNESDSYVEPAHDALVRAWDRLLAWKRDAEEYLPLQRRVADAARDWKQAGETTGLLWNNDPRLPQLQEILDPRPPTRSGLKSLFDSLIRVLWPSGQAFHRQTWLNRIETTFAEQSLQQRGKSLRRLILTVVGVVVALAALATFALYQLERASSLNQDLGLANTNLAKVNTDLETANTNLVAAEATAVAERNEALRALSSQFVSQSATAAEQHLPQRRLLLALEALHVFQNTDLDPSLSALTNLLDGLIGLGGPALTGHESIVLDVEFSPDGRWLASAGGDPLLFTDDTVRLQDLRNPIQEPIVLPHTSDVEMLEFSPDGNWLATVSADHRARLWSLHNLSDPPFMLSQYEQDVVALTFSTDARSIATIGSDGKVRLWHVSRLEKPPITLDSGQVKTPVIAFSPHDHWFAVAVSHETSDADTVYVWNPQDLTKPPALLQNHTRDIYSAAFAPDEQWLATAGEDGRLRLWNPQAWTAAPVILQSHVNGIGSVAFSPDGGRLVSIAAYGENVSTVHVWSTDDLTDEGRRTLSGHGGTIMDIAFSPDSHWLATASTDTTVRLWDLGDLDKAPVVLRGHEDGIWSVAFAPDSRWLATGGFDGLTRLWDTNNRLNDRRVLDLNSGEETLTLDRFVLNGAAHLSADGHWLATVDSNIGISLQNMQNLAQTPQVLLPPETADTLQKPLFSPDSRHFAAVSGSADQQQAHVWNLQGTTLDLLLRYDAESEILSLDFSQDGRWLVAGDADGVARLWDMRAPTIAPIEFVAGSGGVKNITFSPNQRWLLVATYDDTAHQTLWDLRNPDRAPIQLGDEYETFLNVLFSHDDRWLAATTNFIDDTWVRLWDLHAPVEDPIRIPTDGSPQVAFSAGNGYLAVNGGDGIQIWDLNDVSKEPLQVGLYTSEISTVTFSLDDVWLIAVSGPTAHLWNLKNLDGAPIELQVEVGEHMGAITLSPDSRWLVGISDDLAHVWDLQNPTAAPLAIRAHEVDEWRAGEAVVIKVVAFSPDNRWLVTGSQDGTVRLWDLYNPSDDHVLLNLGATPTALEFSPDGRWLLSETQRNAYLWNLSTTEMIRRACGAVGRNFTQEEWRQFFPGQPYRKTCPNVPVPTNLVRPLLHEGRQAAHAGDVEEAIARFEQALALEPDLNLDPEREAQRVADLRIARDLVYEGRDLAYWEGQLEEAVARFEEALKLDPSLNFNPVEKAKRDMVQGLVYRGDASAREGQFEQAVEHYQQAIALEPDDDSLYERLCWYGSLQGKAEEVFLACEQAVALAGQERLALNRGSRGLARALMRDHDGAIEDLSAYVKWSKENGMYEESGKKREAWITELQSGGNPFNSQLLSELVNE